MKTRAELIIDNSNSYIGTKNKELEISHLKIIMSVTKANIKIYKLGLFNDT